MVNPSCEGELRPLLLVPTITHGTRSSLLQHACDYSSYMKAEMLKWQFNFMKCLVFYNTIHDLLTYYYYFY